MYTLEAAATWEFRLFVKSSLHNQFVPFPIVPTQLRNKKKSTMGPLVCFLWQMMAGISGSCYPVILKLKSSTENKSFIKTTIEIHDLKRKLKLVLFNKKNCY